MFSRKRATWKSPNFRARKQDGYDLQQLMFCGNQDQLICSDSEAQYPLHMVLNAKLRHYD